MAYIQTQGWYRSSNIDNTIWHGIDADAGWYVWHDDSAAYMARSLWPTYRIEYTTSAGEEYSYTLLPHDDDVRGKLYWQDTQGTWRLQLTPAGWSVQQRRYAPFGLFPLERHEPGAEEGETVWAGTPWWYVASLPTVDGASATLTPRGTYTDDDPQPHGTIKCIHELYTHTVAVSDYDPDGVCGKYTRSGEDDRIFGAPFWCFSPGESDEVAIIRSCYKRNGFYTYTGAHYDTLIGKYIMGTRGGSNPWWEAEEPEVESNWAWVEMEMQGDPAEPTPTGRTRNAIWQGWTIQGATDADIERAGLQVTGEVALWR